MNYFLAPRSGEKSYKNFESTIRHGVPLSQISAFLNPEEVHLLSGQEVIYAWGNRKGTKVAWERMEIGDMVIFYSKKRLVVAGQVYFKKHSPELALAMWPADDNGNPWEYTFFIKNLKYISIPIEVFNAAVSYKVNNIVQGFTHLQKDRINSLESIYGSVEHMLDLFEDVRSEEIPAERERIYVNIPLINEPLMIHDAPLQPYVPSNSEVKSKHSAKKKIDYEARNKNNSLLGNKGEEIVLKSEYSRLVRAGRKDLADKIERISLEDDSHGYDILSYDEDGSQRFIEVKTSGGNNSSVRFFVSANEYYVGKSIDNYYIYYVEKVNSESPKITVIKNPIDNSKFRIKPDGYIFEANR